MPLKLKNEDRSNTSILIWEVTEDDEFFIQSLMLDSSSQQSLEKYSLKRKKEWLSAQYLIKLLIPNYTTKDFYKDENGKPYARCTDRYLSISHSHQMTSVILSDKLTGIDIQKIHPNIERIAHKFISSEERKMSTPESKLIDMHIIWGAKESMYKAYGKRKLRFIEHMSVQKIENNLYDGLVSKGDIRLNFKLKSQQIEDYILVYAMEN